MNNLTKYLRTKLVIAFTYLFSLSALSRAPFERNPQECGMISITLKKTKRFSGKAVEGRPG